MMIEPDPAARAPFSSADPNLSPEQKALAAETKALIAAMAPTINLMLAVTISKGDPAMGINAMCSALAHFIADTFAAATVKYDADEDGVRSLIDGYRDGLQRGYDAQLEWHRKAYAEQVARDTEGETRQ